MGSVPTARPKRQLRDLPLSTLKEIRAAIRFALDIKGDYTKSYLATPGSPGRTAVRPYRLTGGVSGVWNSDSVLLMLNVVSDALRPEALF
jgi:hypothetical protein